MSDFDWCETLNSRDEWDFRFNDDPVCPHCGHRQSACEFEDGQIFDDGEHEVSCPSCGFDFSVTTHVTFKFSTNKQG